MSKRPAPKPRTQREMTVVFNRAELDILYEQLNTRYAEWRNLFKKEISTRNGCTPQQKLCMDIAEMMSALPNGKNRTREQVKERIKHEVRKIGKWIAVEEEVKRGIDTSRRNVREPPLALMDLVKKMQEEPELMGVPKCSFDNPKSISPHTAATTSMVEDPHCDFDIRNDDATSTILAKLMKRRRVETIQTVHEKNIELLQVEIETARVRYEEAQITRDLRLTELEIAKHKLRELQGVRQVFQQDMQSDFQQNEDFPPITLADLVCKAENGSDRDK